MSKLNKPDDFREPLIKKDDHKHSLLRKIFSPKMLTSVLSGVTRLKKRTESQIAYKTGNRCFSEGYFTEAVKFYDRAVELDRENAYYHRNRGAALWRSGKFWEGVKECERAINLNPNTVKVHEFLASMLVRFGLVDNARKHFLKEPSDEKLSAMFKNVETHLEKCAYARRRDEWSDVFFEADAAIVSGANLSPQVTMCKVETLLKLQRLREAEKVLALVPKVEPFPASFSQSRFCDMITEAYIFFVKSQMYFAQERFDDAAEAIEKASKFDPHNIKIKIYKKKSKLIQRALSNSKPEKWAEAVRYYEILSQALPCDKYIAKSLFQAQVALRFSCDDIEEVSFS